MRTKIYALTLIAIFTFSCTEEKVLEVDVSNELSTLNFDGTDQMISYFNSTVNADAVLSRSSIQKDSEFKSFRDIYLEAMTELDRIETEIEHQQFLRKYSDVLSLVDSAYVPRFNNLFYQTISNREGIYESEGYAHKIIDNKYLIVTNSENIKKLSKINSINNLDTEVYNVIAYDGNGNTFDQGRSMANCGNDLIKDYFKNSRKCKEDRKVYVRAYTSFIVSGAYYTPRAIAEAYGERRNGFCNWKLYATTLATRNCSYTVTATMNGRNYSYPDSFSDRTSNGDVYNIVLHEGSVGSAILWTSGNQPTIQFTQVNLEATSRGVGDNWVELNCQ